MPQDLGRLLIDAGAVSRAEVEAALFVAIVRGISFPRALIDRAAITERALEEELNRRGGLALRQVVGVRDLFIRLPRAMCRRLGAVPLRLDPATGTIDVAAADPLDPHISDELSFHFGAPVRVLRASVAAVEEAIRMLELEEKELPPTRSRARRATPAFPHGAPQSTIPPPPSQDVPIPLIRRVAVPSFDAESPRPARSGRSTRPGLADISAPAPVDPREATTDLDGEPVLPLRHTKTEPGVVSDRGQSPRESVHRPVSSGRGGTGGHGRPPVLREPDAEAPRVSFPSSPPPAIASAVKLLAALMPESAPERRGPDSGRDAAPSTRRHGRLTLDPVATFSPSSPAGRAADAPPPLRGAARADGPPADGSGRLPALPPAPDLAFDGDDEDEPTPQPFADLGDIIDALYLARTRDDVIRLALRGLRLIARRVAIFAAHRGIFRGFACNAEFGDQASLRRLAIPMDQPSILATATATSVYLGPIPGTPTHAPLLDVMVNPSLDVAAVAVQVAGRPAMVLVADQLGDTLNGTRRMDDLARAVGESFSRILSARG